MRLRFDELIDDRRQRGVGDDEAGRAVVEDVADLGAREVPVDERVARPDLGRREHDDEVLDAVAGDDRQRPVRTDAASAEPVAGAVDASTELAERPAPARRTDGRGSSGCAAA